MQETTLETPLTHSFISKLEKFHVLIVEADVHVRAIHLAFASDESYRVSTASDEKTTRELFAKGDVDLILLDADLSKDDGLSLVREIRRQAEVGVILLKEKFKKVDRIVALEMGADDCLAKSCNSRELLARAKNLLRRTNSTRAVVTEELKQLFLGWTINTASKKLTSPVGSEVRLTKYEFDILTTLYRNAGRVLSRDDIFYTVTGKSRVPTDRTVDVVISRLRHKIESDPKDPHIIVSVREVGYALGVPGLSARFV